MNKLFILLYLLTHNLFPDHVKCIEYEFPALEKWTNRLESVEDVENFVRSSSAFGREVVKIYQDESQNTPEPCLGTKRYNLGFALERIHKSRVDHQLMLVFHSFRDYRDSMHTLSLKQHNWIWLFFPIEQGPNDISDPVSLNEFSNADLEHMRPFQMAFGFTSDLDFGHGEYQLRRMESLANKTDQWYTRLEYRTNFIVELSMAVTLNTTDKVRILEPLLQKTMFISFVATNKYESFIIKEKGSMHALAKMFEKDRVFLNVPENVRLFLNPVAWFPESFSLGVTHKSLVGHGGGVLYSILLILFYYIWG